MEKKTKIVEKIIVGKKIKIVEKQNQNSGNQNSGKRNNLVEKKNKIVAKKKHGEKKHWKAEKQNTGKTIANSCRIRGSFDPSGSQQT